MVSIIAAIFLGIVQGITEWLPISSSGHLVIFQQFFGLSVPLLFDIFLHLGTLLVILLVFYEDVFGMLKALFRLDFKSESGKLLKFIIIGSIPTAIIGLVFNDSFESLFSNIRAVSVALIVTGILLYSSKFFYGNKILGYKSSFLIGLVQGISIIPGISRSGSTISTGMMFGIEREKVAKYSFLLSVPAIIGASILEFDAAVFSANLLPIVFGTISSVIVGYFSLKWLMNIIIKKKFNLFCYYCFILGLTLFIFSFF